MISAWGVEHGTEVAKLYQFKESNHKRDAGGRFATVAAKHGFARDGEYTTNEKIATGLAAAGTVATARYGVNLTRAVSHARGLDDAAAATKAKVWAKDTKMTDPMEHTPMDFLARDAKGVIRNKARNQKMTNFRDPAERAAFRYAESMEGMAAVQRSIAIAEKNAPGVRVLSPSYHEAASLGRMVRNSDPNPVPLFRGMAVSEADYAKLSALKPGDTIPARGGINSWSSDVAVTDTYIMQNSLVGMVQGDPRQPVRMIMEAGSGKALNISQRSGRPQSEWITSGDFEVLQVGRVGDFDETLTIVVRQR